MIRLNVFFELKDGVTSAQVKELSDELVAKSRLDEGNKAYDLFESTTRPGVFMFCETWESDAALDKHSNAPHFTYAVPRIEALTKNGLVVERFEK